MNFILCGLIFLSINHHFLSGTVYFADNTNGKDTQYDGKTIAAPFKTIQACVHAMVNPGDECRVRKGRYHEEITFKGKHGTPGQPFIVAGYQNERPLIDGTVPVSLTTSWQKHQPNNTNDGIYKAQIKEKIYQLFVDGKMMTNARWPDALWSDYSVFNSSNWAFSDEASKRGKMVDAKDNLDKLPFSVKGAMAILNIGSFNTFVAEVDKHNIGDNWFTFIDNFGYSHFKPKKNIYFLEDKLELLSRSQEWFFNKTTKTLYLWATNGTNPTGRKIHGKVQDYAFNITDSSNVIFKNLDFFGTTIWSASLSETNIIHNLTFDSLRFNFPSYSKRMLGITEPPSWTKVNGMYSKHKHGRAKAFSRGTFKFINNEFFGADGAAIEYDGVNITVRNNLFAYNDWSGHMSQIPGVGLSTVISNGIGDIFIRNTMANNGASAGYRPWRTPFVSLNHIYGQCWGEILNDGSSIQIPRKAQSHATITKNWVHSTPKYGIRFDDANPPRMGYDGTILDNVVWNSKGIIVKGDRQNVMHNIAFGKRLGRNAGPTALLCTLCVMKHVGKSNRVLNQNSNVSHNGADVANGGRNWKVKGNVTFPLAGKTEHNVVGRVHDQVVDADNFDFRPKASSQYVKENIGPYSLPKGRKLSYYWIPGRQILQASQPIPKDGSTSVIARRDALIWLGGYGAFRHDIYIGQNHDMVDSANHSSKVYHKTLPAHKNVFYLNRRFVKAGNKYYWRIDAVQTAGGIIKGIVWSFSARH